MTTRAPRTTTFIVIALQVGITHVCLLAAEPVVITVPGTSDPWLAGMPNGATASECSPAIRPDVAPEQCPILVTGIELVAGRQVTFKSSGQVSAKGDTNWLSGPEGHPNLGVGLQHVGENGLSGLKAPVNALLGVFLGPEQPNSTGPPDGSDFTSASSRQYELLAPSLKQVFFIGDGYNPGGQVRRIVVPKGATRLFLGVMDQCVFWDNKGGFSVTISCTPSGFLSRAIQTDNRFRPFAIGLLILVIGWLAGAGIGYLTAFLVLRSSHKKMLLHSATSRLKACCPCHRQDIGGSCGLEHTAWTLVVLSEMLHRTGYRSEAKELRTLALEMESIDPLSENAEPTQRNQRETVKKQWAEKIRELY